MFFKKEIFDRINQKELGVKLEIKPELNCYNIFHLIRFPDVRIQISKRNTQ